MTVSSFVLWRLPGTYISPAETGLYYLESRYYNPEIGRFINTDGELSEVGGEVLGYNLFAYCFNNPINKKDSTGQWPEWANTAMKVAAGVAVVAIGVSLTAMTFGGAAPLSVVITATAVGALAGAGTNAAMQYYENGGSWNNFDVNECINAGVSGGLSATLATTPIGLGGQIIGNAFISAANSVANGNSGGGVLLDAAIGGLAGLAGGPGTGRGGFYMNETLRSVRLLTSFGKSYAKSSVVSNSRNIINVICNVSKEPEEEAYLYD